MLPKSDSDHVSLHVLPYRAILQNGDPEARQRMVMALFESGRPEAPTVLRQALRDPDERIRLLAAQALEKVTESFRRSAQAQRRAVEADPSDPRLKIALARLLLERAPWGEPGEAGLASFEEAERLLSAALGEALSPAERDAAWALVGRARARLGRTQAAREAIDRVAATSPDYVSARVIWAETQLRDGNIAEASAEMRRLAGLSTSPEVKEATRFWEGA